MATYTVAKGDTLWAIAKRLLGDGSRWKELYVNGTLAGQTDPRLLQPGATITTSAPSGSAPAPGGGTSSYTVIKGDTLWAIAQKLLGDGSRWKELLVNGTPAGQTDPTKLQIGATITLPGQKAPAPSPTAPTAPVVDRDAGVTDVPPVTVGETVIPQGAGLVIVKQPAGSDATRLYYLTYQWRGVTLVYEIGDAERFTELFGPRAEVFDDIEIMTQARFDDQAQFVLAGSADSLLGATESIGSQIEREVRALGLEDLPSWLADSPDALVLVATATAEDWSSGRLWQELSTTTAFKSRFSTAWSRYYTEGKTIAEAVNELVADENALRAAIRPWLSPASDADTTQFLQEMLNAGWTAGAAAQVLEQAEVLRRDPDSLLLANTILSRSGLATLDEVGFINALAGHGPQDTIEALNTATAARALDEAGIDLPDETIDLLMELVDTSDRLLTADSWRGLAQELSFNLIRFNTELEQGKLGAVEDELIAAAFGRESPTGRSPGEVIDMLARFERDRRAASQGYENVTGFLDEEGRLRIQGLSGL